MNLSITARLTITCAALTALVFVPASLGLYMTVASGITAESARNAERTARDLCFMALYRWDEDQLIEYKDGADPLRALSLNAPHWAFVRGDGRVIQAQGIFARSGAGTALGESFLVEVDAKSYRVASAPLLAAPHTTLESLPEKLRRAVKDASPRGRFLRAKWESAPLRSDPTKGVSIVYVLMFEPAHELEAPRLTELALTQTGKVVHREDDPIGDWMPRQLRESGKWVPRDLAEDIRAESGVTDVWFSSWQEHNGQLIARVRGSDPRQGASDAGSVVEVAVNRLGERFRLDEAGNILGLDPDWRVWLVTAAGAEPEVAAIRRLWWTIVLGLPPVWGAAVLIGWYVTRRALSPVKRIVDTVQRIELSRLDERLPVGGVEDELSRIAATINGMLDRIGDGYLRERQFTGDASHELRGPLAKVIADIDVALSQERDGGEYRDTLVRCRRYARGMQHLVESLLWLARLDARGPRLRAGPFDVTDLIADVVRTLPAEEAARIRLDLVQADRAVGARGDPELIRVLIQNLVQNALRYSPADEAVEIRLDATNGTALIEVRDRGDGIAPDQLARVFSRFYRVDKSRSRATGGAGLGLAIVYQIAEAHGFRVSLRNRAEGGLVAAFSLPTCALTSSAV